MIESVFDTLELDNVIHYNICLFYKQIKLLEWIDDMEIHHLKGYGKSFNYHMGVPLSKYVVQNMDHDF
jgi:hypothetical protein